jgi:hypothetical protein
VFGERIRSEAENEVEILPGMARKQMLKTVVQGMEPRLGVLVIGKRKCDLETCYRVTEEAKKRSHARADGARSFARRP